MAQVGVILNGGATNIHPHLAGLNTILSLKRLYLLSKGVVELQGKWGVG
jgi:hypothetical protein